MSNHFVVGYDGSADSRRALDFAVERAKLGGAKLSVVYVLEWSPYSFLTPEEIEERHKRRSEELDRAESAIINPLRETLDGTGLEFDTIIKYGHVANTIGTVASENGATQIFVGRSGEGGLSARVFGSVAGSLAQNSPVPCTIVP